MPQLETLFQFRVTEAGAHKVHPGSFKIACDGEWRLAEVDSVVEHHDGTADILVRVRHAPFQEMVDFLPEAPFDWQLLSR